MSVIALQSLTWTVHALRSLSLLWVGSVFACSILPSYQWAGDVLTVRWAALICFYADSKETQTREDIFKRIKKQGAVRNYLITLKDVLAPIMRLKELFGGSCPLRQELRLFWEILHLLGASEQVTSGQRFHNKIPGLYSPMMEIITLWGKLAICERHPLGCRGVSGLPTSLLGEFLPSCPQLRG